MPIKTASPAAHGFDPDRLARVDRFLRARYLDSGLLPHAQLLIAREGTPIHFFSEGTARDGGTVVDERTLFRIASMTKPITSVVFMSLVEEGLVALDTPVAKVLPEFKNTGVYAGGGGGAAWTTKPTGEPMLMVDLLRHTAGLTYSFQSRSNIDAAYREKKIENLHRHDLDGFVAALAKLPLEYEPGAAWIYSVATDVLGAVIQRLTGKPLDEVFAERVFKPLGMADTFFHVPADKLDRLADCWAYVPRKGRIFYDRGATSVWGRAPKLLSGGGGLVSTTLDYHRFCQMLANGGELGGKRIIGRKTLDLMTRNHLPGGGDLGTLSRSLFSESTNEGVGFGLGFAVTQNVARTLIPGSAGEYYWGGMFSTAFFIDPVEKLHAVFMTQLAPSTLYPIRRELKTLIYAAMT